MNRIIKKIIIKNLKKKLHKFGNNSAIDASTVIVGGNFINIGDNFSAGRNLYLQVWNSYRGKPIGYVPKLIIGDNVSMMDDCQLSCVQSIKIEDGVLFGNNVFITDNFHGESTPQEMLIPPLKRRLFSKGPVLIKKNVWLGRNVCVMPNVVIGEGAVIGANSVVTHNIPDYSIAVGSPARIIKQYKSNNFHNKYK